MAEKTYTKEEIFELLKDHDKFISEFCQPEEKNQEIIQDRPSAGQSYEAGNYDKYSTSNNILDRSEQVFMDENGNLYKKPLTFTSRQVPKITRDEYELLEFCHNTDMIPFLREEFRRNPIDLAMVQQSYEISMRESCSNYINTFDPNDFKNEEW